MNRPDDAASRREFLQGKAAARAVASLAQQLAPGDSAAEATGQTSPFSSPEAATYLVHLSRRAMACQFEFFLNAGQYPQGTQAALAGLDLVDRLEAQLSVYRPDSEISRLNARAAEQPVVVEGQLFALLAAAVDLHGQTQGAFDITAGRLSEAWGFTRCAGAMPREEQIAEALARVGSQYLELNAKDCSVAFRRPELQINLGAIGKGYALDRVAAELAADGVHDFLLHGGHSSVLARGTHGALAQGSGWSVGIRHPLRPDRRLGQLQVVDEAVASSGSGTQFFLHQGRRFGHIIDPRSGWPAEGVLSATVLAPTAAQADALSTAFYVLGSDRAVQYCAVHPPAACVLVLPGDKLGTVEIVTHGLRSGQWRDCEP